MWDYHSEIAFSVPEGFTQLLLDQPGQVFKLIMGTFSLLVFFSA